MTRPGDRLRALAARVCSAKTMERLIDPIVTDLQMEYLDAIRQGRVWRGRWVRIAGYVAMLKVLVFLSGEVAMRTLDGIVDHDRTTWRFIGWTVSATAVMLALLAIWPLLNLAAEVTPLSDGDRSKLLLYLVPQALVVAVPIGITIGILGGLAGRLSSRRLKHSVLAIGFVCSLGMFAMLAWIVPASNQAFRVTFAGHDLAKGLHELTLGEVGQRVIRAEVHGDVVGEPSARELSIAYHSRWAFSLATFVLALFSLSIVRPRSAGRTIVGMAACVLYFAYYITVYDGTNPLRVHVGSLPAFAIAWFPNVVLVVTSVALITVRLKADPTYDRGREG